MGKSTRREFVSRAAVASGGLATASLTGASSGAPAQAVPRSKTQALRALLEAPGVTLVPETHCVYAARLAELSGFPAVYVGGNLMAGMYLGIEDWGLIDLAELVEIGGRIARGVSVPTIVDADQGGETALNAYRAVGAYESAGISGFHIEDTRNPKHRGQGKSELMQLEEMLQRIAAAVEGRTDPDFLILARSDCLILGDKRGDTDEAIRRGNAFAEAGADGFFLVGMQSDQVETIASAVPIPLVALNIPLPEVRDTSLKMDIHGVQIYQAAMELYQRMLGELDEHGEFLDRDQRRLPRELSAKVLRKDPYEKLADAWSKLEG